MRLLPRLQLQLREELVYTAHTSWWSQGHLVALGLAFMPLAGLGAVLLVRAWWLVQSNKVWVTNQRLVWQQGLLARRVVEVRLHRIDAVVIEQSLNARLMGYGSVEVGAGELGRIRLEAVAEPMALRAAIVEVQSRAP